MIVHTSEMTDLYRLPFRYLVYFFTFCFHVSFLFANFSSPFIIKLSHPIVTVSQGPPHLVLFYYFFPSFLFIKLLFVCTYVDSFVFLAQTRHKSPIFTFPMRLKYPFLHLLEITFLNDR